jgi:hypothetical protein
MGMGLSTRPVKAENKLYLKAIQSLVARAMGLSV